MTDSTRGDALPYMPVADRNNSFDTLRLVSALMVLVGHAFVLTRQNVVEIAGIPVHTMGLLNLFVISGYLTTYSWQRDPRFFHYFVKRSLRIFPGLLAALLFIALVIGPLFTAYPLKSYFTNPYTALFVVRNTALWFDDWLPGVFSDYPLEGGSNGVLWTLPIEFGLYFTVPMFVLLCRRSRMGAAVLMGAAIVLIWLAMITPLKLDHKIYRVDFDAALEVIPFFIFGSALALATTRASIQQHAASSAFVCGVIILLIGLVPHNWNYVLILPALSLLIVTLGESRLLHFQWLRRAGDLSYGVYLFHWPVLSALVVLVGIGVHAFILTGIAAILVAPYAWASWRFVERPALSKKKYLSRRTQVVRSA